MTCLSRLFFKEILIPHLFFAYKFKIWLIKAKGGLMYLWLILSFACTALLSGCSDKNDKTIDFGPNGDDSEYSEPGYH
jgi:hypothetical protein